MALSFPAMALESITDDELSELSGAGVGLVFEELVYDASDAEIKITGIEGTSNDEGIQVEGVYIGGQGSIPKDQTGVHGVTPVSLGRISSPYEVDIVDVGTNTALAITTPKYSGVDNITSNSFLTGDFVQRVATAKSLKDQISELSKSFVDAIMNRENELINLQAELETEKRKVEDYSAGRGCTFFTCGSRRRAAEQRVEELEDTEIPNKEGQVAQAKQAYEDAKPQIAIDSKPFNDQLGLISLNQGGDIARTSFGARFRFTVTSGTVERNDVYQIAATGVTLENSKLRLWSDDGDTVGDLHLKIYADTLDIYSCDLTSTCNTPASQADAGVYVSSFLADLYLGTGDIQPVDFAVDEDGNFNVTVRSIKNEHEAFYRAVQSGADSEYDPNDQYAKSSIYINDLMIGGSRTSDIGLPTGGLSLGSSKIEGLMIQYLNVQSFDL
ncbi:hypothetical protein PAHA111176_13970 [Parendozoicomonas haliclonae]|uniref:Uncharacterized protein n=2 Tax=Parendozoicomonas haliclonae TaxID=1960125 RepID=A0A1X7AIF4_9GAMM|nr:hypothetical protein EHSB41UT_01613 [Parendozoicomonas haliclonae]